MWFTGLSGAGKTTLAQALRPWLETQLAVEVLDGDEVSARKPVALREGQPTTVAID